MTRLRARTLTRLVDMWIAREDAEAEEKKLAEARP